MMPLQTLRIVWFAIVMTIPIYAAVGWFVGGQGEPPEPMVPYGIAAVAAGPAVFSFLVGKGRPIAVPYPTAAILRVALSESVALNGFVIQFLGGPVAIAIAMYLAALVLLLIHAPNERAAEEASRP